MAICTVQGSAFIFRYSSKIRVVMMHPEFSKFIRFDPLIACSELRESVESSLKVFFQNNPTEILAVNTFFHLESCLDKITPDNVHRVSPLYHLLFDLDRVILFRDGGEAGRPGLSSLLHYLRDGYPMQPFSDLSVAENGRAFAFCFDPVIIDMAAQCLDRLQPEGYKILSASSGEVTTGRLITHPLALGELVLSRSVEPPDDPIYDSVYSSNRSLRSSSAPGLSEYVNQAAGMIRYTRSALNPASLYLAVTEIAWERGERREQCFGQALSSKVARAVAACEAVERFQMIYPPPETKFVKGSYHELSKVAIDPCSLFFGRSPECPDDENTLFDPTASLSWTWAWAPFERRWRLSPAQEIWYNIPKLLNESSFVRCNTNGCAVGSTLAEASVFAALEVIERDAFLTSWYLRRPAREIDFSTFESEDLSALLDRFQLSFPGYRVVMFDLTSDVRVPVVGGLAIRQSGVGPKVFFSCAAHIDAKHACLSALKDLTGFEPNRAMSKKVDSPVEPAHPDGSPGAHFERYALDENFSAFDQLGLGQRPQISLAEINSGSLFEEMPSLELNMVLETLGAQLASVGAELYLKNIGQPALSDMGLIAVRAIAPGLFPLWFGASSRRFRVTERLKRLAQRYTGRPFDPSRLNLAPHPLT